MQGHFLLDGFSLGKFTENPNVDLSIGMRGSWGINIPHGYTQVIAEAKGFFTPIMETK